MPANSKRNRRCFSAAKNIGDFKNQIVNKCALSGVLIVGDERVKIYYEV